MRFSPPSEMMAAGSDERKRLESKEKGERHLEREKVSLELIEELKRREASGVGNKGDFYSNEASGVGVKHLARPERMMDYENSVLQEARMQTAALLIVEKARMEHQARIDKETDPARKEWLAKRMPAKVPYVVGYVRDEEAAARGEASEYIIMETVKGKTLSHLMFQKMAERLYKRDSQKYAMFEGSEGWREDVLIGALVAHVDELKGYSKEDAARVIYNSLHGTGVVTEEVALQIGAAVRALNNAGFFHRDLHERNIMISDDGTQASIIDFGSSMHDPKLGSGGSVDRSSAYDIGHGRTLWNDASVVTSLPNLTSNPREPLKPNARKIRL